MRIYIIEDDGQKAQQISILLDSCYAGSDVQLHGSYQSGLKAIERFPPDLLILDMNLPTFDNVGNRRAGRPRALGGYEILRKMKRRHIETSAIVITQLESFGDGTEQVSFAEIVARCHAEFPQTFLGGVYYSRLSDSWQEEVRALLKGITKGV